MNYQYEKSNDNFMETAPWGDFALRQQRVMSPEYSIRAPGSSLHQFPAMEKGAQAPSLCKTQKAAGWITSVFCLVVFFFIFVGLDYLVFRAAAEQALINRESVHAVR